VVIILLLLTGTAGYMVFEDLGLFEALYLVTMTVSTVGYGDVHPVTVAGRMLTLLLVPLGLLVVFGLGVATVADRLDDLVLRGGAGAMERKLAGLKDHFIVCGYGRLGQATVATLRRLGGQVVAIDLDRERFGQAPSGFLYLVGDALRDEILLKAGIRRARAVISTFSDDVLNVYLALEARDLAPDVEVLSTASDHEATRRLQQAGVDRVVSPQTLGGEMLAKSAFNPGVYQLMSDVMWGALPAATIAQVVVAPSSVLAGRTLGDFRELGVAARVLLVRTPKSTVLSPSGDLRLDPGSIMVVIGEGPEVAKLERLAGPKL